MTAARMSKLAALPLAMLLVPVSCGGADDGQPPGGGEEISFG
jgi:hypothetical protein